MESRHYHRIAIIRSLAIEVLINLLLVACGSPTLTPIPDVGRPQGGSEFAVEVTWNLPDELGKGLMNDSTITKVFVEAFDSEGAAIGSGYLAKKAMYWSGWISVSQPGYAAFTAHVKDESGAEVYYGEASIVVTGKDDLVTIPTSLHSHDILGIISRPGAYFEALALDDTRNLLFAFDKTTGSIYEYDALSLSDLGRIPTTLGECSSMVIDESLGKLYTGGGAVVDIPSKTVVTYLPQYGFLLVGDEDSDVVYAAGIGSVKRINADTDAVTEIAGIWGNTYTSLALNPLTHELFVANYSQNNDKLFIINGSTLDVTSVPNMAGCGVAVNWLDNKAYVSYAQRNCQLGIYDRDEGTSLILPTNNDSTWPLVFNPLVNRLYSNTEVNAVATIVDGATDQFTGVSLKQGMWVVGVRYSTDNVYYVDATATYVMKGSTREILAEFPDPGEEPALTSRCITIGQSSGRVYVVNESVHGRITVIQDRIFVPPSVRCLVSIPSSGSVDGALESTDYHSRIMGTYWDCYYADQYSIEVVAGQQIAISADAVEEWARPYIRFFLLDPMGAIIAQSGYRIPETGYFTFPQDGTYIIEVTSFYEGMQFPYRLTLTGNQ